MRTCGQASIGSFTRGSAAVKPAALQPGQQKLHQDGDDERVRDVDHHAGQEVEAVLANVFLAYERFRGEQDGKSRVLAEQDEDVDQDVLAFADEAAGAGALFGGALCASAVLGRPVINRVIRRSG